MARSTSTGVADSGPLDEADEMFDQAAKAKAVAEGDDESLFEGLDDLLDEVEEDDSEGWVPSEKGASIVGIVVKVSVTRSDFATDGQDPMCPTVTLKVKDGTKFRIIGYGAVLKREMQDKDPQVGDTMAVKYFGEKPIRNGKFAGRPYKHFGVAVKGPDGKLK
jgi:hypothetical protein